MSLVTSFNYNGSSLSYFYFTYFSCGTCIVAYTDDTSLTIARAVPVDAICPIFILLPLITPLIGALITMLAKSLWFLAKATFCASKFAFDVSILACEL